MVYNYCNEFGNENYEFVKCTNISFYHINSFGVLFSDLQASSKSNYCYHRWHSLGEKVKLHEMKNEKNYVGFLFLYIKYSKFWSILLEHFVELKPLISEEWMYIATKGFAYLNKWYLLCLWNLKKKLREISTVKEDGKMGEGKKLSSRHRVGVFKTYCFFLFRKKIALKIKFILITIDGTVRLLETWTLFLNLILFLVVSISSGGGIPLNEKRFTGGGGAGTVVFCIKLAFFFRNNFEFPANSGLSSSWSPTSVLEELLDVVSII